MEKCININFCVKVANAIVMYYFCSGDVLKTNCVRENILYLQEMIYSGIPQIQTSLGPTQSVLIREVFYFKGCLIFVRYNRDRAQWPYWMSLFQGCPQGGGFSYVLSFKRVHTVNVKLLVRTGGLIRCSNKGRESFGTVSLWSYAIICESTDPLPTTNA